MSKGEMGPVPSARARVRDVLPHLIAIVAFVVCVCRFYDARTGFTSLIGFGSRFAPPKPSPPCRRCLATSLAVPLDTTGSFTRKSRPIPCSAIRPPTARWTICPSVRGASSSLGPPMRPVWRARGGFFKPMRCRTSSAALALSLLLWRWFPPGTAQMTAPDRHHVQRRGAVVGPPRAARRP